MAQEQQQAQQQAMVESLGPNAINQAGNLMKEGMANQAEAPTEEPPAQ
jgi:hypothetical protein